MDGPTFVASLAARIVAFHLAVGNPLRLNPTEMSENAVRRLNAIVDAVPARFLRDAVACLYPDLPAIPDPPVRVRPSTRHGQGVFATANIAAGTVLFHYLPSIAMVTFPSSTPGRTMQIPLRNDALCPPAIREEDLVMYHEYSWDMCYSPPDNSAPNIAVPADSVAAAVPRGQSLMIVKAVALEHGTPPRNVARYINDSVRLSKTARQREKEISDPLFFYHYLRFAREANVHFARTNRPGEIYCTAVAVSDIAAGEELLTTYGDGYFSQQWGYDALAGRALLGEQEAMRTLQGLGLTREMLSQYRQAMTFAVAQSNRASERLDALENET